jgi:hypothetical protein
MCTSPCARPSLPLTPPPPRILPCIPHFSQVPPGAGSPVFKDVALSITNNNLHCNPMQFRARVVAAVVDPGSGSSTAFQDLPTPGAAAAGALPSGGSSPSPQPSGSVVTASQVDPGALFGCNNITVQVRKDNSPNEVYVVVVNSTDHIILESVYDVQTPVMTKSVM